MNKWHEALMNDTYGLPITCCRPCQIDLTGLCVLGVCFGSASLGVGLKNWTIHIPSPTTAQPVANTRKSTVFVVDDIFTL